MVRWWNRKPILAFSFSLLFISSPAFSAESVSDRATGRVRGQQAVFGRIATQWLNGTHAAELRLKFSRTFDLKQFRMGVQGKLLCESPPDFSDTARWVSPSSNELVVDLGALKWENSPSFGEWLAQLQNRNGKLRFWVQSPWAMTGAELRFFPATPYKIPSIANLKLDPNSVIQRTSTVKVLFQSTVSASKFECRADGKAWSECRSPWTLSDQTNGYHTISVRAYSVDGRPGPIWNDWFYVYVPPASVVIQKVSPTENPTESTSKTITFTHAAGWFPLGSFYSASMECRLDGGAYRTCKSPMTFGGLAAGDHVVEIRSALKLYPFLPWLRYVYYGYPATHRWTVQPQNVQIAWRKTPAEYSSSASAQLEFILSSAAQTRCSLDGQAAVACTSPWKVDGLAEGSHTAKVEALVNGAVKASIEHRWLVDRTAPVIEWSQLDPSDALTSRTSLSGQFQINEPATVSCDLDGRTLDACPSPFTLGPITDGVHRFTVRATDRAANVSSISHDWEVDTQSPTLEVSLVSPISSPASQTYAAFQLKAEGSVGFACSLDGAAAVTCAAQWEVSELGEGQHSLQVVALDTAGNYSEPKTIQWTVDTIAPVLSRYSRTPAESTTTSRSATLEFTTEEAASYFCALNGSGLAPCTSPWVVNGLMDGQHAIEIQAVDLAGNKSKVISDTWSVAATVLTSITSFSPTDSLSNRRDAQSEFVAPGASRFECRLDNGAWSSCTSPWTQSGLSNGTHRFEVRGFNALDEVGTSASHDWTIDATAPLLTLQSFTPTENLTSQNSFETTFSTDKTATIYCALDAESPAPCTSPWSRSGLVDGAHSIQLYSLDSLGNRSAAITKSWTVDTVVPALAWVSFSPTAAVTSASTFDAAFIGNKAGLLFDCSLDGVSKACTSPWTQGGLADGTHTLSITARDTLGRVSAPLSKLWAVDTKAPVVQIGTVTPSEKITSSKLISIDFSANESAEFSCSLDGAAEVVCNQSVSFSNLADGNHVFTVQASDLAGNASVPQTYAWTVDTVGPTLSIVSITPSLSPTSRTSLTVNFNPGVDAVKSFCSVDGAAAVECASPWSLTGLSDGNHKIEIYSQDAAGLSSNLATYTWTIRTTPLDIDNVAVTLVSKNSATLSWTTNLPASSQVVYGSSGPMDQRTGVQHGMVIVHTVDLTGLDSNTLYRATAVSVDADGRSVSSSVVSFRTLR